LVKELNSLLDEYILNEDMEGFVASYEHQIGKRKVTCMFSRMRASLMYCTQSKNCLLSFRSSEMPDLYWDCMFLKTPHRARRNATGVRCLSSFRMSLLHSRKWKPLNKCTRPKLAISSDYHKKRECRKYLDDLKQLYKLLTETDPTTNRENAIANEAIYTPSFSIRTLYDHRHCRVAPFNRSVYHLQTFLSTISQLNLSMCLHQNQSGADGIVAVREFFRAKLERYEDPFTSNCMLWCYLIHEYEEKRDSQREAKAQKKHIEHDDSEQGTTKFKTEDRFKDYALHKSVYSKHEIELPDDHQSFIAFSSV